jgi:hypothetical protein
MKRSFSHTYLNTKISPQATLPNKNLELQGNLVKRVVDTKSALWDGMILCDKASENPKKSEIRWKESEVTKRTIDPSFNEDFVERPPRTTSRANTGNLTDMINRGFSRDNLGNFNKKVCLNGKNIYVNAMSYDNIHASDGITGAYKDVHPGHGVFQERRQKKTTVIGDDKKVSQISTLPGHHKEFIEEVRPIKIKPDYNSSINELPGYLRNPEKVPDPPNPYVKFTRNTATTTEKQIQWGPEREKRGPKQEVIPGNSSILSDFSQIGKESNVRYK